MAKYTAEYQNSEIVYTLVFRKIAFKWIINLKLKYEGTYHYDSAYSTQIGRTFPDMKEPLFSKERHIDVICGAEPKDIFDILTMLEKYE